VYSLDLRLLITTYVLVYTLDLRLLITTYVLVTSKKYIRQYDDMAWTPVSVKILTSTNDHYYILSRTTVLKTQHEMFEDTKVVIKRRKSKLYVTSTIIMFVRYDVTEYDVTGCNTHKFRSQMDRKWDKSQVTSLGMCLPRLLQYSEPVSILYYYTITADDFSLFFFISKHMKSFF
jgi:hypothetical protein